MPLGNRILLRQGRSERNASRYNDLVSLGVRVRRAADCHSL